jgi:uncharacterized protein (DUF697 family)
MAQKTASGNTQKKDAVAEKEWTAPETITEITPEQRNQFASKLVDRFALWSGVAGLIPVPVVDLAAVGGLQLQMLRRLSQVYGVPFSANRGKALIAALVGVIIPASSGAGVASLLKSVPVIGTAIATLVMPALASGATYAIGKVFIQHFNSGGTLLDFNPPDYREYIKEHYREFIKDQKEMWSTRSSTTSLGHGTSSSSGSDTSKGTVTTNS